MKYDDPNFMYLKSPGCQVGDDREREGWVPKAQLGALGSGPDERRHGPDTD